MRNEVGLIMARGVNYVNVSWLPIGQQCLIDFFCHSGLLSTAWRNLQIKLQV